MLTYEDDYNTEKFRESNSVPVLLRDQQFRFPRQTVQELQEEAAAASADDGKQKFFLEEWFKSRLSPEDFDRFWKLVNTEGNPVHSSTLVAIIKDVTAQLNTGVNAESEDFPKD